MLTLRQVRADKTGELVAEALSKRRLSRDGGAYVLRIDVEPGTQGAIAGVPIAVKDVIDVDGARTRCGSAARRDVAAAERDASVVAHLRSAGAAIIGKSALHEFAFGATGINHFEGTPTNPRRRGCVPGGSSSGSAVAVAEGSAVAALGTDTGGSVRVPAALCGVVGYKPAFGLLSMEGVFPLSPSLDHVGVLAPDVETVTAILRVLNPSLGAVSKPLRRIGIDKRALEDADDEVARTVESALRALEDIEICQADLPDAQRVLDVSTAIMFKEAAAVHEELLLSRAQDYGSDIRERLARGREIDDATYQAALREARDLRAAIAALLEAFDGLVGPTVPIVAPRIDSVTPGIGSTLVRNTRLANVVGRPAISIPVPKSGAPVGLQFVASTDADALAGGAILEELMARGQ